MSNNSGIETSEGIHGNKETPLDIMIGSANRTPENNLNLNSVCLISVLKMGDITLISAIKQTKINK